MNFINNWRQQLALAQAAASADLELPDGEYVLTLSDGLGQAATRWEYIRATVAAGTAVLMRAQEGSEQQDWPEGSWIYCSVTAGVLVGLFERIELQDATLASQAAQIADLAERVAALEPPALPRLTVTVGSSGGYIVGYSSGGLGGIEPSGVEVPGYGSYPVTIVNFANETPPQFTLIFTGHFPVDRIVSINVEGCGVLAVADADTAANEEGGGGDPPSTVYVWSVAETDWFASVGQHRTVEFTFAAD